MKKIIYLPLIWGGLLVAAGLQVMALSWPFPSLGEISFGQSIGWVQWIATAIFFYALDQAPSMRQSFLRAWLFWSLYLLISLDWLYTTMHVYGQMPVVFAVCIVVLLSTALSLFYGVAAMIYHWRRPTDKHPFLRAIFFSCLFAMAEVARGTWLTGFGWANPAYSQLESPIISFAPWMGVYGVNFLLLLCCSLMVSWIFLFTKTAGYRSISAWLALGCMLLVFGIGWLAPEHYFSFSRASGAPISVELLQGNIDQSEKFAQAGVMTALRWYRGKLLTSASELTIAPETAIPLLPGDLPDSYWEELRDKFSASSSKQAALIGSPWGRFSTGYENAVVGLKPGEQQPYLYFKSHLVPFGEYVPPFFWWVVELMNIPLGNFRAGAVVQPSFVWRGEKIAPDICFEILFGEELAERFRYAKDAPNILVTVSNLAWFGDSRALWQHLSIVRMRALELQRPILQVNNTGITAIINAQGEVTASLPVSVRAVLDGAVSGRSGETPYAWWASRYGLWPLWLVLLVIVLVCSARKAWDN